MESNNYKKVYVTVQLSRNTNKLLTESSARSRRNKLQEAKLRLEDHLHRFRSISELNHTIPHSIKEEANESNNQ